MDCPRWSQHSQPTSRLSPIGGNRCSWAPVPYTLLIQKENTWTSRHSPMASTSTVRSQSGYSLLPLLALVEKLVNFRDGHPGTELTITGILCLPALGEASTHSVA